MDEWSVVLHVKGTHDRSGFCCGVESLDRFLNSLIGQYEKRDLGRTYVLIRRGESNVFGYYTLAAGSVAFATLPEVSTKKLPRHPLPVVLLGRLAVDQRLQGQGLGAYLLADALRRCLELSERLGVHAVEVHAVDEKARSFYEKYGFAPLKDDPSTSF